MAPAKAALPAADAVIDRASIFDWIEKNAV